MTLNSDYTNIFETKIMVFDFDGVIIDSTEVKVDEYRNLFSQFTKNEDTLNKIISIYRNSAGIPREITLKKVFKEVLDKTVSNQEVENLSLDYSKQIFQRLEAIEPLKGFLEYLAIHKEINKHIISGAPNSDVSYLIKKLNLTKYFSIAIIMKMILYGIIIVAIFTFISFNPIPFIISFTSYYLTLHLTEAFIVRSFIDNN